MRFFSDSHQCECGNIFEWKTLFLHSGEGWFGRWDEARQNVVDQNSINKQYHITIKCPKCNRKYFIVKE